MSKPLFTRSSAVRSIAEGFGLKTGGLYYDTYSKKNRPKIMARLKLCINERGRFPSIRAQHAAQLLATLPDVHSAKVYRSVHRSGPIHDPYTALVVEWKRKPGGPKLSSLAQGQLRTMLGLD